jgi:hypothetical protein
MSPPARRLLPLGATLVLAALAACSNATMPKPDATDPTGDPWERVGKTLGKVETAPKPMAVAPVTQSAQPAPVASPQAPATPKP